MKHPEYIEQTVNRIHRQGGFSLVEMMIAMTISLVIILAVTQIFVSSRGTYSYTEGMSRVQESGRFAIDFIAKDIRMAGYTGCSRRLGNLKVNNILANPKRAGTFDVSGMEVFRYTGNGGAALGDWTPPLPDAAADGYFAANEVLPFTDVFVAKYGVSLDAFITGSDAANSNLQILNTAEAQSAFKQGDVVMVTDCNNADIFGITNNPNYNGPNITLTYGIAGINSANRLGTEYDTRAEVLRWQSRVYYVGLPDLDGDGNPDANATPTLMRKELVTGNLISQPLVEGVERMQIMLGMDSSTSPTRFRDSTAEIYVLPGDPAAADLGKVVAIRIGFAITTDENIDGDPDSRVYNVLGLTGETYDNYGPGNTAADYGDDSKQRRKVFTMTVARRN